MLSSKSSWHGAIKPKNPSNKIDRDITPLPKPDAKGNYPALDYLRASIARDIIRDRLALGLTQKELARRAGVRVETLCRIETGKNTASVATVDKIDRALKLAARNRKVK